MVPALRAPHTPALDAAHVENEADHTRRLVEAERARWQQAEAAKAKLREAEEEQTRRLVEAERVRWQQAEAVQFASQSKNERDPLLTVVGDEGHDALAPQMNLLIEAERARWQQAIAERARQEAEAERAQQQAIADPARQVAEAERARQQAIAAIAEVARQQAIAERARQQAVAERARHEAEAELARQQAIAERARHEAEVERARQQAIAGRARREAEAEQIRQREEEVGKNTEPPDRFCCAISGEVMTRPVVARDGNTYDEVNIRAWLQQEVAAGRVGSSPFTREEMADGDWFLNRALREEIEMWHEAGRPAVEANDPRKIIEVLQRRLAEEEAARQQERALALENLALLDQVLEADVEEAEPRRNGPAGGLVQTNCEICGDRLPLVDSVSCEGGDGAGHTLCRECLSNHITTSVDGEYANRFADDHCRIMCIHRGQCSGSFPLGAIGKATQDAQAAFLRGITHHAEAEHAARYAEQLWATLCRTDSESAVDRHARHIEETILNLTCPRCGQVFGDFDGCTALRCSRAGCRCAFCAYCQRDCGEDAHAHARICPEGQDLHVSQAIWQEHMRARRAGKVVEYLRRPDVVPHSVALMQKLSAQMRDNEIHLPL